MTRIRLAATMLAAGLLLAGCADRSEPGAAPPAATDPGAGTDSPGGDPVHLIGMWTVTGTGIEPGQILRLAPDDLSVITPCGVRGGSWRADPVGVFLAGTDTVLAGGSAQLGAGAASGCAAPTPGSPDWLVRAVGFRLTGDGPLLTDGQGRTVARLTPGAQPRPNPNIADDQLRPPKVTDEDRRALAASTPLPPDLTPAEPGALVGRWVPAQERAGDAYLELSAGGQWRGSDGCNGQAGRWASGPAGVLLATSGASTLIGCENVPVGSWLAGAARAGLSGDELVLLGRDGTENGRLRRAG
ncbi:hypothetical protein [Plantactinospora sp. KBS50]|uniref:hypothetical protein n=1 Tax=Plantactinospora sp. KBS50 TaxID=2024580 RepID=UPI0012FE60ED|nr:hypothetical protein [Plantactinospora sp. KBS50]